MTCPSTKSDSTHFSLRCLKPRYFAPRAMPHLFPMPQALSNRIFASFMLATLLFSTAQAFAENFTLGLPPISIPINNPQTPAKIALGRKLFEDQRLSADAKVSCATCHKAKQAFSDGLPMARGIREQLGTRNTPSLINVAYQQSFFWDGRRPSLEAQVKEPFLHPREQGLSNVQDLLQRIRSDPEYVVAFKRVFGVTNEPVSLEQISLALASFQRSLVAGNSAFDRYYFAGDKKALSSSAQRGLKLFQGSAQCTTCHIIDKNTALFTDHQFHSLTVGLNKIETRIVDLSTRVANATQAERERLVLVDGTFAEMGRFLITGNPEDIGKFKTPSLRNVAETAPYMHDGSVATLDEAVDLEVYYRGVAQSRPLILTPADKVDLIEFLKALSSSVIP